MDVLAPGSHCAPQQGWSGAADMICGEATEKGDPVSVRSCLHHLGDADDESRRASRPRGHSVTWCDVEAMVRYLPAEELPTTSIPSRRATPEFERSESLPTPTNQRVLQSELDCSRTSSNPGSPCTVTVFWDEKWEKISRMSDDALI